MAVKFSNRAELEQYIISLVKNPRTYLGIVSHVGKGAQNLTVIVLHDLVEQNKIEQTDSGRFRLKANT